MENLATRRGECGTDHEFEYLLWLAIHLVIWLVIPGDVGAGVSKAPYVGAGFGGGGDRNGDGRGGAEHDR